MINATPLLRLYAARRLRTLSAQDPVAAQRRHLSRLVERAMNTRFGHDHGFAKIRDVAGYQARVPLRRYESFWNTYWRDAFPRLDNLTWPGVIPFMAVTSGTTTGSTKFIPYSRNISRATARASLDTLVHHLHHHPDSKVLGGKAFMLGGSTDLVQEAPGVRSGDMSGIAAADAPFWSRPVRYPPLDIALMTDWEAKIDRLARDSPTVDIRLLGGVPSWLLILFERIAAVHGGTGAVDHFPNLELLVHGGVQFSPYRQHFESYLKGSRADLREVYPASEGFIAVADRGPGEGLRLIVDNGLFFEFVPAESLDDPAPPRHWLGTLETGVNYALVLTSCAGLWSYILGDTVRFVDLRPPRLLITGRTSYMLSAFGEHLIGEEIETAVAESAELLGVEVNEYSVGPVYPQAARELGHHLFIVEFREPPEAAIVAAFAETVDERLSAINDDYRAHRSQGYGMAPPSVWSVAPGTFVAWMKQRGQLGGQHKVPRVIADANLFAELQSFAAEHRA